MKIKLDNSITIFIPCYNSQTTIEKTLNSLEKQISPHIYEIIFIDDGSTDRTINIITNHFKHSKYQYKLIKNSKPTSLAKKYNDILEIVKSKFILYIHSDIYIENDDAIKNYFEIMQNDDVVAAISIVKHSIKDWKKYSFWQKCEFDRLVNTERYALTGKFDIFRVNTLREINGFDNKTYYAAGEDGDIEFKLKKIGKIEKANNSFIHQHSFEVNYPLYKLLYRHARYAEAQGTNLRNHFSDYIKIDHIKEDLLTFFRELMVLYLLITIIITCYIKNLIPFILLIVIYLVYSILYTKNTIKYSQDKRIILLPFINILLIFISTYFSIKGFLLKRQTL